MSGSTLPDPLTQSPSSSSTGAPSEIPSGSYRWYALGLLTVVYVVNFVDRQILSILLGSIKEEFGLTDTELGFLAGITFALFYATLGIPIAMWADRGNRRNIITLALTVFSVMTALCGQATSFAYLVVARIGVGVGEAGASPPSHSILSDLFPPKERATALGIFATGVNIGIMIGFFAGGYINDLYGWRMAFMVVGVPGLLLAVIVRFTLKEPERGASEGRAGEAAEAAPSIGSAAKKFFRTRTLRHIALASALNAFVGYGAVTWFAEFLRRSYQMSSSESGLTLAIMFGIVGGIGTFFGGYTADRLAKRDIRWNLWLPAAVVVIAMPFTFGVFLSDTSAASLAFFILPALVGTVYLGPSIAMVQALVPLRMRTVASAILLFVINIIGLGLGPQMVGVMSDLLADRFADESLRYALLMAATINLWSAAHFVIAARSLKQDLARVAENTAE